ncbi:cytochrome c biogenesis protein ResB [Granulicoccus phenolivorans]|uniref:cytochrome c biogenesis protein ResB n=1 Tax=Granulicoccus phenolivorans TaxID=266854 RepID=UPI0009DBF218|nr:cytochrome c biogenesis protein ResB [Granulicoccus phenolivorans]
MSTDTDTRATPVEQPAPDRRRRRDAPGLSLRELLRFCWTQLTAMRTALTLLFLAALAAIPGSLFPQRSVSPGQVRTFLAEQPFWGPVLDALRLFDVYTSPWFSAIYLLLLVSLIGCITPRTIAYAKAVRAQPVATPRRLSRLPAYLSVRTRDPQGALDRAETWLRAKHFRIRRDGDSISAERGYLREAGNLVFHVSLVIMLLGIAAGVLYGYRGTAVVPEGRGFSNNLTQYDDISSGAMFTDRDLTPFTVLADQLDVRFETGPHAFGAPREFTLHARYTEGGPLESATIQVNHPLQLSDGTQVHLLAHGYAPQITVRDGNGQVAWSGPVVFVPEDGNFNSTGVIKVPDARPERLAFEGRLLPTAVVDERGTRSAFPDAENPVLFLTAYAGAPKAESGVPENVYTLDKTGMRQLTRAQEIQLTPGSSYQLPDGGSVSFDGLQRWTRLQVSHTPAMGVTLVGTGLAVLGLCLSLFIRPRRLWVRVPAVGAGGDPVIEVAGLDRADARSGLDIDVEDLAIAAADLDRAAPGNGPDPADTETPSRVTGDRAEES